MKKKISNLRYLAISFIINLVFRGRASAAVVNEVPLYGVQPVILYGVQPSPSPELMILGAARNLAVPISIFISFIFGALWLAKKISNKAFLIILGIIILGCAVIITVANFI